MKKIKCPSTKILAGMVHGTLSEDTFETVVEHVETCSECEQKVEEIEAGQDALVKKLRVGRPFDEFASEQSGSRIVANQDHSPRHETMVVPAGISTMTGTIIDRLIASRLVTQDQIDRAQSADSSTSDDHALLERLVHQNELTPWQAEQIRSAATMNFFFGPYKLTRLLGVGGMGKVYEAHDSRLDRTVALKVVGTANASSADNERFLREAKAALQLRHSNIVQTFELGEQGSNYYLVMEVVDGIDLKGHITNHGRLTPTQTVQIALDALAALQHAHEQGIIHRDIKPSNFMVTREGQVKLTDMGLAKIHGQDAQTASDMTRSGAFMGTVDYCAPEQAEDAKRATPSSDLYAVGCTLYHCLTGQPPFPDGTVVQKIVSHRELEPVRIDQLNPEVPGPLADLIHHHMLAKQPAQRFQSAADAAAYFQQWMPGQEVRDELALLGEAVVFERNAQALRGPEAAIATQHPQSTVPNLSVAASPKPTADHVPWSVGFTTMVVAGVLLGVLLAGSLGYYFWNPTHESQHAAADDSVHESGHTEGTDSVDAGSMDATRSATDGNLSEQSGAVYALRLTGEDSIELTSTTALISQEKSFTVEMWFRHHGDTSENDNSATFPRFALLGDMVKPGMHPDFPAQEEIRGCVLHLQQTSDNSNSMDLHRGNQHTRIRFSSIPSGTWHHLAICWGDQQGKVYLNGKSGNVLSSGKDWYSSVANLVVGHSGFTGYEPARIEVDVRALKVSTFKRYTVNFKPVENFTSDDQTEVLLDFSKQNGNTIPDLSGNGHHGIIQGAKWVSVNDAMPSGSGEELTSLQDKARRAIDWATGAGASQVSILLPKQAPAEPNRYVTVTGVDALPPGFKLSHIVFSQENSDHVDDQGFSNIDGVSTLVHVALSNTQISDQGLESLSGNTNLESLNLISMPNVSDDGLRHAGKLTRLESLKLKDMSISHIGLAHLTTLKFLKKLDFEGMQVTQREIDEISKMTSLTQVAFRQCTFVDASLEKVNQLKELYSLFVSDSNLSDEMLLGLNSMPGLRNLELTSTPITDRGLENLKRFPSLTALTLSQTNVTDDGMDHLAKISSVKSLSLFAVQGITDQGIAKLHGMTNLTRLTIGSTPVTRDGYEAIQKALPKCNVEWREPRR